MIGKVLRGRHVRRLLYYLYGPGRANEHTDPHLVAGFADPADLEPERRRNGARDFRRLTGLLEQPLAALAGPGYAKPVWHCAVRSAPGDRMLSDAEWAQVAARVMHRTGLAPGGDDLGVRWVAVRHADDHIHVVATLARQDGRRPRIWNDFYRVREACRDAEKWFGLRSTAPADRTANRRPGRAEAEQAARRGWAEAPRTRLCREVATAAAGAGTEQEFFAGLADAGVAVRKRYSSTNPGEVTGYAVGLRKHTGKDGGIIWYGGSKLAADLSLPKLRRRWGPLRNSTARPGGTFRFTAPERDSIYAHAARQAAHATEHIRRCAYTDPGRAADAAWAAADTLHVAARALRNPELRRAAQCYSRAARPCYGRIPPPSPEGARLRAAARLMAMAGVVTGDNSLAVAALIAKLAALVIAIAELRAAQQHAAQAAAARAAARHLNACVHARPSMRQRSRARTRHASRPVTAANLARGDFPTPVPVAVHSPTADGARGQAPRPRQGPKRHQRAGPDR